MNKLLQRITWLVIIVPAIYLLIIWRKIPAIVPVHYNLNGEADRYGSKKEIWLFVGILIVVSVGLSLLLTNLHRIDPRKKAVENRDTMFRLVFAICLFISSVCVMIIYYTANPGVKFGFHFILTGIGLLFAIIGNYMYTIKPNYFAGLRLPWTLENEENWRKTHLLGGKLWFAGGLLIAVISLFTPELVSFIITGIIILIMVIIPTVYSYRLYKKQATANTIN